jgi:hypothetical protein
MTPLIAAARAGRLEVVDLLLRNGASLNSYNPRARVGSALFQACAHGHIEVVKLLTSRGARFLSDNPPEYPIPGALCRPAPLPTPARLTRSLPQPSPCLRSPWCVSSARPTQSRSLTTWSSAARSSMPFAGRRRGELHARAAQCDPFSC